MNYLTNFLVLMTFAVFLDKVSLSSPINGSLSSPMNNYTVPPSINYLENEELYNCAKCLCDIDRGWWTKQRCATYPFPQYYWRKAGRITVDPKDDPMSPTSYEKCAKNETCIVVTILKYTESYGQLDCNCDGKYDCQDRSAIHLFGKDCSKYFTKYSTWFGECWKHIGINTSVRTTCPKKSPGQLL